MIPRSDHPLAGLFPLMEGPDFDGLVEDIRKNGLREPIVLIGDQVLDGRNRRRACEVAKVAPRFTPFEGSVEEATAFVVSLNLRRRHLSESQRATVAARLANLSHGGDRRSDQAANLPLEPRDRTRPSVEPVKVSREPLQQRSAPVRPPVVPPLARQSSPPPVSHSAAAKLLNVSERSVRDAKAMIEKAVPGLIKAVDQGKVSVAAALVASKQPPAEQKRFVEVPKAEQRQAVRDWRTAVKAKAEPVDEDMEIETVALGFLQIHDAKIEPRNLARRALAGTLQDLREHGKRVRQFLDAIEETARHDAA